MAGSAVWTSRVPDSRSGMVAELEQLERFLRVCLIALVWFYQTMTIRTGRWDIHDPHTSEGTNNSLSLAPWKLWYVLALPLAPAARAVTWQTSFRRPATSFLSRWLHLPCNQSS